MCRAQPWGKISLVNASLRRLCLGLTPQQLRMITAYNVSRRLPALGTINLAATNSCHWPHRSQVRTLTATVARSTCPGCPVPVTNCLTASQNLSQSPCQFVSPTSFLPGTLVCFGRQLHRKSPVEVDF
jgi:hypothetical protein